VGSRVLLVVPPAQAYPSGNPRSDIKVGETMVYVVDILFSYEA
jgi:peptidylprolyl isomerase